MMLSEYCHPAKFEKKLAKMVPRGLEQRTLQLLAVRSNQMSYETSCTIPPQPSRTGKMLSKELQERV
jgi:hypothetical protein